MKIEEKNILGVKVNIGHTYESVIELVDSYISGGGKHHIVTTNAEFIVDAQKDSEFRQIINKSDLSLPDGFGVLYAAAYLESINGLKKNFMYPLSAFLKGIHLALFESNTIGTTVTGADLMDHLASHSALTGNSIFLLGGMQKDSKGNFITNGLDLANKTKTILEQKYPGIKIVGATSKFTSDEKDDEGTVTYINEVCSRAELSSIDILFVAYNHSKQEKWINRNLSNLNVRVVIGVGGSFDFISNTVTRAPKTFQKYHIEWIYRLIKQPWRFKRILKAFPYFPYLIYKSNL